MLMFTIMFLLMLLSILTAFAGLLIIAILVKYVRYDRFTDGIPEPPGVPVFRHFFYFWKKDHQLASAKIWRMMKGCDIFRLDDLVVQFPVLMVRGLQCIEEVIRSPKLYGRSNILSDAFPAFKGSLADIDGEIHKQHKAFLLKAFSPDHMKGYIPIFHKCMEHTCQELVKRCDHSGYCKSIQIINYFSDLAFSIIQEAGSGIPVNTDEARKNTARFQEIFSTTLSPESQLALNWLRPILTRIPFGPLQHCQHVVQSHFDFVGQGLLEKKKRIENNEATSANILSMLLKLRWKEGSSLTDEMLTANIITFSAAGSETAARALTWCVYYFAKEKARDEVNAIVRNANQLAYDDIKKLPYLTNVIKETLRCTGILPVISRCVKKDTTLGRHHLKAGQEVFIHVQNMLKDEDIFPEADVFDPDRFDRMTPTQSSMFIPFGCPPFTCLGKRFAMAEILICLAHILKKFQVEEDPDYKGFVTSNVIVRVDTPPLQVCLRRLANSDE